MTSGKTAHAEPSANALLAAEMRPALVRYFKRKCGTAEEAEDLTQDVLVRSLSHITLKSPEWAKGYIFRAAVNRWRDWKRRARTHGVTLEWNGALESELDGEIDPERVLITADELNRVATGLRQLNERTQDIFILVRLEQIKQAVVAEMLGISLSTVEKELVRAVAHLARCIGRSDGTT